mgnify:FL=1
MVVGENTCDGKKKAYEFFATQKNMYVMDIPNVHDKSTLVTWKAEVKKLAAKIEEECGVTITPERLKAAIHAVNENVAPCSASLPRALPTRRPSAVSTAC